MPPTRIELDPKKQPEAPEKWAYKVQAKIRDAGDGALAIRTFLLPKWPQLKVAWAAGAHLVLLIDDDKVSYELVAPPKNKKAVQAVVDLKALSRGSTRSSGPEKIDDEALIEDAKQLAKLPEVRKPKGPMQSWTVLEHDNLLQLLKYDDEAHAFKVEGSPRLSVVITDSAVLKRLAEAEDIPLVQQQVREAVDLKGIAGRLDKVLKKLDVLMTKDPTKGKIANQLFMLQVEEEVAKGVDRAISQIAHFKQVRRDYKKYRVKAGLKLTATVVGIGLSVASIATAGFTGGASAILGLVGLARSVVSAGEQMAKLAAEAETVAKNLSNTLVTLQDEFQKSVKKAATKGVVLETLSAATGLPSSLFKTAKQAREKLGLLNDKTNGLEVKAQDASRMVNAMLEQTTALEREFGKWLLKQDMQKLDAKQKRALRDFLAAMKQLMVRTQQAIDDTIGYFERTTKMREAYKILAEGVRKINAQEPGLAKFLAAALPGLINVGLALAGAETTALLEGWSKVTDVVGNSIGVFGNVLDGTMAVKDTFDAVDEAFPA